MKIYFVLSTIVIRMGVARTRESTPPTYDKVNVYNTSQSETASQVGNVENGIEYF